MHRSVLAALMLVVAFSIFGAGCIVRHPGHHGRRHHRVRVKPAKHHRTHRTHRKHRKHRRSKCGPNHYWTGSRCRHR
jgi:hypothetical protein